MKNIGLFLIALIVGCGSSDRNDEVRLVESNSSEAILASVSPKDGSDQVSVNARLFSSLADLGSCTLEGDGALVYIKDEAMFYHCDGQILDWTAITLKGEDGKDGTNGTNGKDAETIQENEWRNPLNSSKYILVSVKTGEYNCPTGSSKVSEDSSDFSGGVIWSSEISGAYNRFNKDFAYASGTISGTSDDGKAYVSFMTKDGANMVVEDASGNFTGTAYPRNTLICKVD